MSFTGVTICAGLGASSKAIRDRGGVVLAAIEREEAPAESLVLNGFSVFHTDMRAVDYRRFGRIDVLIGGFPCQPFSQSGRNAGQDDERDMFLEFIRAIDEGQPEFFIGENVTGLATRHKDYLEHRINQIRKLGYNVEYRVLDCADYGVAQNRKRLFIIGRRDGGEIHWPGKRAKQITMAEALGWSYLDAHERALQAPAYGNFNWVFDRPSTTVVGSFRPEVQAAPGYRKAGDGPRQNAPGSVVTTHEERLVLQGLPRDWQVSSGFSGNSRSKRDLQVGNTCPPIVLMSILAVNGY